MNSSPADLGGLGHEHEPDPRQQLRASQSLLALGVYVAFAAVLWTSTTSSA